MKTLLALAMESVLETLLPSDSATQDNQIVIQGGPGTGKTIVAVYLMKLLTDIANCEPGEELDIDSLFSDFFQVGYREVAAHWRIGLVIPQQSLRKTIQKVFRSIPGLSPKMVLVHLTLGSRLKMGFANSR